MDMQVLVSELALVLGQAEIARAVGVTQSSVSRWIAGERKRIEYETGEALLDLRRKHARAIAKAKRK